MGNKLRTCQCGDGVVKMADGMGEYWALCTCGMSGPMKNTKEEAAKFWNTRADDALIRRLGDALEAALWLADVRNFNPRTTYKALRGFEVNTVMFNTYRVSSYSAIAKNAEDEVARTIAAIADLEAWEEENAAE